MSDSAASLNGAAWSLTALALIVVGLRVYARTRIAHAFGADDAVIIVAVVISTAYSSMLTAATYYGTGTPLIEIPLPDLDFAIEMNILAGVFGIIAFSIPKLSVGLLLCRVLNPKPVTKFFLIAAPSFAILWSCALVIVTFTQCNPSTGIWQPEIKPDCISPNVLTVMGIFAGSFSALLDIVFAVYPAVVVIQLNMSWKKKVGLCAVFSLGFFAAAVTIVKCFQVPGLADHTNVTQSDVELLIWTSIETNVVIFAACIPTLGPLINQKNRTTNKTPNRSSYKDFSGKGEGYSYNLRNTGDKTVSISASALASHVDEEAEYETYPNDIQRSNISPIDDGNITKTVEVYTTTIQSKQNSTQRTREASQDEPNGLGQGGDVRTWYEMPERQPKYNS